jgi:hypothetical protein
MMITTYDDAMQALHDAEDDVAGDFGEDMVDQAFGDIVESVGRMITDPELQAEFVRRQLGWIPLWVSPQVAAIMERDGALT